MAWTYNAGTVCWRIANLTPREYGELTLDARSCLRSRGHEMQGADTLAIQTSIFSETLMSSKVQCTTCAEMNSETNLTDEQGHLSPDEFAYRPGIVVQVSTGETLVRAVEERVVSFFQEHVADLTPLFPRGVDTSGIVRTSMQ